jgi:hypothetical protein
MESDSEEKAGSEGGLDTKMESDSEERLPDLEEIMEALERISLSSGKGPCILSKGDDSAEFLKPELPPLPV